MSQGHYEVADCKTGGHFISTSPYVEEFRERMNEELPKDARRWNPSEMAWWIHADYLDEAVAIAEDFYDEN
jgi:hypothetical protein